MQHNSFQFFQFSQSPEAISYQVATCWGRPLISGGRQPSAFRGRDPVKNLPLESIWGNSENTKRFEQTFTTLFAALQGPLASSFSGQGQPESSLWL
jgi:hypothetical protein